MSKKTYFKIPIVFCADSQFVRHAMVTMLSIIKENQEYYFKFYLLGNEFDQKNNEIISGKIQSLGSIFEFIKIKDDSFESFPTPHHFSKANYYRLLIPDVVSENLVIYLDADIVVKSQFKKFLEINLENQVLAAVEDPIYIWKSELGMKSDFPYFNSGVMMINVSLWKEMDISRKAFDFISENPEKIRFVDQCALNAVINGNFLELSPKFNQQAILFLDNFDYSSTNWTSEEIIEAKNNPIIIHFTGPSKPWNYNSNHPLKNEYWRIQKSSPFKLRFPEGMSWSDHLKLIFPNSLKSKLKSILNLS